LTRKKQKAEEVPEVAQEAPREMPLRLEWRSPQELAENPANWRLHPESQTTALTDVIAEVGWAGACLYNEVSGRLIDGHARRKLALEQGCELVPVLVGSWTEEQERKILATLDPLSAMAEADGPALAALLADVSTGSPALQAMLSELAEKAGVIPYTGTGDVSAPEDFKSYDEDIPTEHQCPRCGYKWSGSTGGSDGVVDAPDGDGEDGDG
jgi:hypothetical protein